MLIKCKECDHDVSDKAAACPNCGAPLKDAPSVEFVAVSSEGDTKWKRASVISFIVSALMLFEGFYKIFRYKSPDEYGSDAVNAYVGGDAYNFIINSTLPAVYFVLAGTAAIMGVGFIIAWYLSKFHRDQRLHL